MGSYILSGFWGDDINEQSFQEFLGEFQQSGLHPRSASVLEKAQVQYFPLQLSNKDRIFLSVSVVLKQPIRYIAVITIVIGLLFVELLTQLVPLLATWITGWGSLATILVVLGFALPYIIVLFSPAIILTRFDRLCALEDFYLKEVLTRNHLIEVSALTPPNC